ncbi:MAG: flagellar basal body P-ring formation chaperone FlgA [Alphaproteobacteria bacterium]
MKTRKILAAMAAAFLWSATADAAGTPARRCEAGPGLEEELVRQLFEKIGSCPMLSLGIADARALAEAKPGLAIVNLRVDMRVGTFSAVLAQALDAGGTKVVRQLRGGLSLPREVPVVTRRIVPGEVIDASDIRMVSVDSRHVPPNAVLDADQLVGLEPRWPIAPLVPVSRAQVRNALAVERGAGVRATFRSAGIELTTQLVAVDAGAIGQTITLRNPSSNKLVRGRVVDSGAVVLE